MKIFLIIIILFISTNIFAQVEVSGGMGIGFVNNSSVEDYVNVNFAGNGNNLQTFNSAIEFYLEGDYYLTNNFQFGVEYDLLYFSYTDAQRGSGNYELNYDHYKPSVVAYYVIKGIGYNFKIGGGVGPRFIVLEEKLPFNISRVNYKSSGFGVLIKGQGNTLLGGNFYANIAVDMRYDFPGEPETTAGKKLFNNAYKENVNINSLTFSLKLGISYFF